MAPYTQMPVLIQEKKLSYMDVFLYDNLNQQFHLDKDKLEEIDYRVFQKNKYSDLSE